MSFHDHKRGAAPVSGELHFAQSMEAVDYEDPQSLMEERECQRARERLAKSRVALELARELGDASAIRLFSRVHSAAQATWAECGSGEDGDGLTLSGVLGIREEEDEQQQRVRHFRIFLEYVTMGARKGDLGAMLRNLLAITAKISPDLLRGLPLTEIAALTGEDKQAAHARSKRLVVEFAKERGVAGHRFMGANASESARGNMAKAAKGNKNRSNAAKRARGEKVTPVPAKPKRERGPRKPAALLRFGLDEPGRFLVVCMGSGEKREAETLRAARELWVSGGMREGGSSDDAPNTAAVMIRPEKGRAIRVASLTGKGHLVDLRGERIE